MLKQMKRHLITLYMARPAIWCWLAHRKYRSEIEEYGSGIIRHCVKCGLTWVSLSGFTREVEAAVMVGLGMTVIALLTSIVIINS